MTRNIPDNISDEEIDSQFGPDDDFDPESRFRDVEDDGAFLEDIIDNE